jgi:hypothetical protein
MRDRKCHWVLSRTSVSYNLIIFCELALSLVFCPFPALLCSWGAPSISLPVTWLSITSFPVTWFSVTSLPVAPPKYDLNRADILLRAVHRVNTIDSQDLLLRNVSYHCDNCLECEECMNIVQIGSCTAIKQWKYISRTRAKWIYRWFNYGRYNICIFLRRWRYLATLSEV